MERDGNGIVYLYKAEPFQQLVRMASHVGLRNPMYCTGVGKSILALLPQKEAEEIWNSEEIQAFSPSTITTFPDMIKEMERIRTRGYAIDDEEHDPGSDAQAAAIRNWAGRRWLPSAFPLRSPGWMSNHGPTASQAAGHCGRNQPDAGVCPFLMELQSNNAARISVRHCCILSGIRPPGNR